MSADCRKCFNEQIPPYVSETEETDDWLDAKVDGVSVEGIPLDGHYLDHLINDLQSRKQIN